VSTLALHRGNMRFGVPNFQHLVPLFPARQGKRIFAFRARSERLVPPLLQSE
jgi:hypothetical protein